MRTTIELDDEQRAQLLEIAARRGMKGFSKLVREAVDVYLQSQAQRGNEVRAALAMQGLLDDEEAADLASRCAAIREDWR